MRPLRPAAISGSVACSSSVTLSLPPGAIGAAGRTTITDGDSALTAQLDPTQAPRVKRTGGVHAGSPGRRAGGRTALA
jgi:hypothetical protein